MFNHFYSKYLVLLTMAPRKRRDFGFIPTTKGKQRYQSELDDFVISCCVYSDRPICANTCMYVPGTWGIDTSTK